MESEVCGQILLVGDGDFSLSRSLLQYHRPDQITTSSLETEASITKHQHALSNCELLLDQGVDVLCGIDACNLESYPSIATESFRRIIFNFPHVGGKSNNKKNRKLLNDFFCSAVKVLDSEGQIMVTLCKGQGGTAADQPQRAWADSWQVVSMAADAGLILTGIHPFQPADYPGYVCTGFRSQDKWFHIEGALTHVFSQSLPIAVPQLSDVTSPTPALPHHLSRNLFEEVGHPLCILKEQVIERLKRMWCVRVIPPDNSLTEDGRVPVIPLQKAIETLLQNVISPSEDLVVNFRAVLNMEEADFYESVVSHTMLCVCRSTELQDLVSKFQALFSHSCSSSPEDRFQITPASAGPDTNKYLQAAGFELKHCIKVCSKSQGVAVNVGKVYQHHGDSGTGVGQCMVTMSLDRVMCDLCGIEDHRMLRSADQRFLSQFTNTIPVCSRQFHPFSLYPIEFCHDMSFWENPHVDFDPELYNRIVYNVAGDVLASVRLLDTFTDKNTNMVSRCYRLTFRSCDRALSYDTSWRLQSTIRLVVEREMEITLR